ncbi:MAG: 4-hydroxybenzoate octaprenyltransferase [Alphaproteobacteria bacterium]
MTAPPTSSEKPNTPDAPDLTDIRPDDWVDRLLPGPVRPYARLMRLDRPIGTWLLLFPCWWGLALASLAPDPRLFILMALFGLGALVMRGAGCTWNDITDREFDAKVARTRTRPIPSGQVKVWQAFVFLAVELLVGLAILLAVAYIGGPPFNWFAVWVGAASLVLVVIYPLMKRVTYWPQIFLGLAFNYGALLGWATLNASLDLTRWPGGWPSALLYLAGIFWTLGYDTIYAHQDKEDDALVGIKSTALKLGRDTRIYLFGFYALACALIFWSGKLMGLSYVFWVFLALGAAQLVWQAARVELDDPIDCLAKFKSNRLFGWLILAGLLGDAMLDGLI